MQILRRGVCGEGPTSSGMPVKDSSKRQSFTNPHVATVEGVMLYMFDPYCAATGCG